MPLNFTISISYSDIYDDYDEIIVEELIRDIPTRMALVLVTHYTGQLHTREFEPQYQLNFIREWSNRFNINTINRIKEVLKKNHEAGNSTFNFINNVSSLYLTECLLQNHNTLPDVNNLNPLQEENLFKAYLYFSDKWIKEQLQGIQNTESINDKILVMLLPFSELFEFKDFRLQFLKAVYFFRFCETDETFSVYLNSFLQAMGVNTWNQYLFNLVSVYITLFQKDNIKTLINFSDDDIKVFSFLENLCIDTNDFQPSQDFLSLREKPIYRYDNSQLLFLNLNFFIDKIYQGIKFDFADVLIKNNLTYKGKLIEKRPQFFGIYSDEFIETGLFFKVMEYVFRQKDYKHFSGNLLKEKFGNGIPDYLIVDNRKLYVFEFKNATFKGSVKYSYDITKVQAEIKQKLVQNEYGRPKGLTQLVNFLKDLASNRYADIIKADFSDLIIYPIIVSNDYTFNLPIIYQTIKSTFFEILNDTQLHNTNHKIQAPTLIDLDTIIKFQDLFITKKITLNHVLNDYQIFLNSRVDSHDKTLSFNKYLHVKTLKMKYESPKMFFDLVNSELLNK